MSCILLVGTYILYEPSVHHGRKLDLFFFFNSDDKLTAILSLEYIHI